MNRKKHEKTCPHCAFMHAASRLHKKHGGAKAKVQAVKSARNVTSALFATMTPEDQTQFIKDVTTPRPDTGSVMEAVKSAIEALSAKVKVTEH